ncbi:MAG: hypothetical protein O7H41_06785 [Planctomycetota bacterium]|nr:hypothetical protein [Planctomycetota bacterium]
MRTWTLIAILLLFASTGSVPRPPGPADDPDVLIPSDPQGCAAGCAAIPISDPDLTRDEFEDLLVRLAREPLNEMSPALETLLFYGPRAARLLAIHGAAALDSAGARFLEKELARQEIWVAMRLVDEKGTVRARMAPTRIPLGERRHLRVEEATDLQPPEFSGTVRRVGLNHIWTRW